MGCRIPIVSICMGNLSEYKALMYSFINDGFNLMQIDIRFNVKLYQIPSQLLQIDQ